MNGYLEVSNKYFKQNKKRTLVNIIAIILATMFISGTGHMIYSSQQNIITMLREDGDYHVIFKLTQKDKFPAIKVHSAVEKAAFRERLGSTQLGDRTLLLNKINKDGFDLLGVKLQEGRLPEHADELILNSDFKDKQQKNIGDKVTFRLNDNTNIDYTIVGFSQYTNNAFMRTFDAYSVSSNMQSDSADVYVKLKEVGKLNSKIESLVKDFSIDANKVLKNEPLLTALGEGRSKSALLDYITFFMIAVIVMISTLVFIYNSFNISTMERMKEYGLIKAIGGTNKQIKRIILKEAFIVGIIALPIGLLLGMSTGSLLFKAFNSLILSKSITVKTYYSLYSILVTILLTVITLYLSVMSMLRKVKKISPLDCFTNRNYEVKKINIKKWTFINKLFNIEGIIANRNIRSNKGRFRTTVVSIVLSITLFITFSSLVGNIEQLPYEALPIDMQLCSHNHYFSNLYTEKDSKDMIRNNSEQIKLVADNTKKIYGVKDVYSIYQCIKSYTFLPEKKVMVKGDAINIKGNNYTNIKSEIVPIDLDTIDQLSPYLLNKFNNKEKMKKENGVFITQIYYEQDLKSLSGTKYKKKDISTLKAGDEILIDTANLTYAGKFESNDNTVSEAMKVKVLGIVRVILFDKGNFSDASPIIYMPTELYNKMIEKKSVNIPKNIGADADKKLELDKLQPAQLKGMVVSYKDNVSNKERGDIGSELLEKWKTCYDNGKVNSCSIFSEKNDKYIKFSKLFYFSVIAFIALISMANVFNIVNTNVILRSKELALLGVVGASKNSIKKIMYLEGILYSIIGIIYGTALGWLNSIIIGKIFRSGHDIAYVFPYKETLISIMFFIIVGISAIYFPLRKIKKENLLQYKEY
ncbi:ABC transporter permease [Clostridium sp. YIM B02515]|uniref:ABC transporter permease n=1 Tax=Clostridium rhizosphaerae TaxID=2803861 RepID=A0ABS1TGY4_9CLOT|nr:ABC transporter permease [Clostridium rhizosphaerae]MBL4937594.1 ABC transporter permease [Clostridium rhizosphaerae]